MRIYFLVFPFIALALGACLTDGHSRRVASLEPCEDWTSYLGESQQCTNADGGALGPDMVRREITQKVVTEGYPLTHQEYALATLLFNYDGEYQARKLRFTWYFNERGGEKIYLVYAEDSKGRYRVEEDGAIAFEAPYYSTCDERKSGSDKIYPHIQNFPRQQPYRTSIPNETAIVFETKGWLGEFSGRDVWNGTVESRTGYKLPPFPSDTDKALTYDFDGFKADIYYGCLNKGYEIFEGKQKETITLVQEFRYEKGVNPNQFRAGTQFTITP